MPFAIALAVSVLLHAAAITMPGWDLPGQFDPPSALEARLPPPPASGAPGKAKPTPRPLPAKKPAAAAPTSAIAAPAAPEPSIVPEGIAGTPDTGETVVAASPEAQAEPAAEPVSISAPVAPPWPRVGRVRYVVTYGEHGFVIGETVHEWLIEGGRYMIRSVAEPKGLAVLRGYMRKQESSGDVTAGGLRPREFRDQREGRGLETAMFDWTAARVVFSGDRGTGALGEGTQDLLSVFYQLAWQAPRDSVELRVATASRVKHWTFEWIGEDIIKLPEMELTALHLRTRAEGDTTEVWLAPAYGGLPVKIRHVDRKGEMFEQMVDSLELN